MAGTIIADRIQADTGTGSVQILSNTGTTVATFGGDGQLRFVAGSASVPAIAPAGDLNTGIFFPAADTIAFTEGGVESMRIDSSGNLGLGTTSLNPLSNLIYRQLSLVGSASGGGAIYLADSGGSVTASISTDNSGGNALFIDTRTSSPIVFRTTAATVERMRIDSSGNLGLGGTPQPYLNPNYNALDMHSGRTVLMSSSGTPQTNLQTNAYYDSTDSRFEYSQTGFAASLYQQQSGEHRWYNAPSGTAGNPITFTQAMTLNASGILLVGTTSASASLAAGGLQVTDRICVGTGSVGTPSLHASGDTNTGLYFPGADIVGFATGGTERARITSGGDFQFNSGYGSVATAYGCRAWVNFNGTGTVAIRASGNVSSITDNGVGDYTVNFTNAMPDANYAPLITFGDAGSTITLRVLNAPAAGSQRFTIASTAAVAVDVTYVAVGVFR